MAVSSATSSAAATTVQNSKLFMQQQEQQARAGEANKDQSKVGFTAQTEPAPQKSGVRNTSEEQKMAAQKADAQRLETQKLEEQRANQIKEAQREAPKPTVNTRGQTVGTLIDITA